MIFFYSDCTTNCLVGWPQHFVGGNGTSWHYIGQGNLQNSSKSWAPLVTSKVSSVTSASVGNRDPIQIRIAVQPKIVILNDDDDSMKNTMGKKSSKNSAFLMALSRLFKTSASFINKLDVKQNSPINGCGSCFWRKWTWALTILKFSSQQKMW